MSATVRARMARAARAALGEEAQAGPARKAAVQRLADGGRRAPLSFADLEAVPDWLPATPRDRRALLQAAALAAMAPALARSIDGAWLGALASRAGPDLIDWAMDVGERDDHPAPDPAMLPPHALEPTGAAIIRTRLPPALHPYLDGGDPPSAAVAGWALDRARERVRP